jgi:hypothetical protein
MSGLLFYFHVLSERVRVKLYGLVGLAPIPGLSISAERRNFDKDVACVWLTSFELCHQTAVLA